MVVPLSTLNTGPRREPELALPVPPSAAAADRVRQAAALDNGKKAIELTPMQTHGALAEINRALKMALIGVQFEFDKEANTMIAKVVDVETGEVIRQMPSEEMVRVSKVLGKLQGLLVSQKV